MSRERKSVEDEFLYSVGQGCGWVVGIGIGLVIFVHAYRFLEWLGWAA